MCITKSFQLHQIQLQELYLLILLPSLLLCPKKYFLFIQFIGTPKTWSWIHLFASFLAISTNSSTFFLYSSSCFAYSLIFCTNLTNKHIVVIQLRFMRLNYFLDFELKLLNEEWLECPTMIFLSTLFSSVMMSLPSWTFSSLYYHQNVLI